MSTDGSGVSECCAGALFERIEEEIDGVDETARRGPSGTKVGLVASFARLLDAEETRVSYGNLVGKGLSVGMKEGGGVVGEEGPIIGEEGSRTGLSMVGR